MRLTQEEAERTKGRQASMCRRRKKLTRMQERGWLGHSLFLISMGLSRLLMRLAWPGREKLPKEGAYLLVANHQSMFDGLWIMGGLPKKDRARFSALAGSDLEEQFGLTGKMMFRVGRAIPIDRFGNPLRGLLLAKKALEQGDIVLIHPEGTRTHDGRIGEMLNGAAYLGIKAGVPVVPVYIEGAYQVFSRHMSIPRPIDWKKMRRKKIRIHFLPPLYPEEWGDKDHLMEAISSCLLEKEEALLGPLLLRD